MNKKILIISYNFPPIVGGIETYAKYLINYFEKENIKCIYPEKKMPINAYLRAFSMVKFSIKVLLKIIFKKYDIIHLTNFNLWIIAFTYSLIHKKTKFIINLWGLELVYKNKKGFLPFLHKIFVPIGLIQKQKRFIFLTSSTASNKLASQSGINQKRIRTIPLGVPKEDIMPLTKKVIFKKYFLFSGRVTERKGLSWFAENILPEFPEYKLIITGSMIEKNELKKTLDIKNTEWLGRVSKKDLIKLRQESTAVIIPNIFQENNSDFEAYGFVTIESVANSSLVVASNYQGLADSLVKGKLGFLAEPSDSSSWLETLNKVIKIEKNEKIKIINKRLTYIKNNLLWDDIFKETNNLYNSF